MDYDRIRSRRMVQRKRREAVDLQEKFKVWNSVASGERQGTGGGAGKGKLGELLNR